MLLPGLTDQQSALVLAEGNLFVEACPGAGKTRAIVARFLKRTAEEPRKGVALLSFTNTAIDELTQRCGQRPDALVVPHFVGTFDSFINRFITRPLYVRQYGRTPRFIDAWRVMPTATFRISDMDRLPSLELDWFEFDPALRASLNSIPPRYERQLEPLVATRRGVMEARAYSICRALVRNGTLSCSASRAVAAGYLSDPTTNELVGTLLAARFAEVIVDEAQDCGPEELMVLRLLQQSGVTIVAVADLDQAIFEFRRADPGGVRDFAESLLARLPLDGNFRSSPAICALNTSLRHGQRPEAAVGENASLSTPIQLMEFRQSGALAGRIDALAASHGLTQQEVIFLAHRGSDARKGAGAPDSVAGGGNRVLGIAWANSVLKSADSRSRERLRAIELIERTLRAVGRVESDDGELGIEVLDERWLRETAIRLAAGLDPSNLTARDYAARIRQHLQQIDWPAGVKLADNLGSRIKAPSDSEWQAATGDPGVFGSATIHSFKGREFPGVVVVLPSNLLKDNAGRHAVDHWDSDTASEFRRVVYVGASRAEKLLVLAVHSDHLQRVISRIERDAVPYVLHREQRSPRR